MLDADPGALFAVSPATGQRAVISLSTDGNQPQMRTPRNLAWDEYNQRVILADSDALLAIEAASGTRSYVSRTDVLGGGPGFVAPRAVAVWTSEPGNDVFFVADSGLDALLYVDVDLDSATSGDRVLLSGAEVGTGAAFDRPIDVVWDNTRQQAVVIDDGRRALIAVDPDSGDRTLLSSAERGNGPRFVSPKAVVWDPSGDRLLVLDTTLRAIFLVDPITGERVIVAR